MKNILLIVILVFVSFTAKSQTTRYFEFRMHSHNGNWKDTSFVVTATDSALIYEVTNEMTLPVNQRRFITGAVAYGNGGFNHNASHWFSWRFVSDTWALYVANVEFCDGSLTGLDNHPSLLAGDTGWFCPWNSYPYQEISNPSLSVEDLNSDIQITIYPNPSANKVYFKWKSSNYLLIDIYNVTGQRVFTTRISKQKNEVDISNLSNGLYFAHLTDGNKREIKKIIVKK